MYVWNYCGLANEIDLMEDLDRESSANPSDGVAALNTSVVTDFIGNVMIDCFFPDCFTLTLRGHSNEMEDGYRPNE